MKKINFSQNLMKFIDCTIFFNFSIPTFISVKVLRMRFQWNYCHNKIFRGQIIIDMCCKKVPVDMLLSVPVDGFIRRWEVAIRTDCKYSMHMFKVAFTRGRANIWSFKYLAI